MSNVSIEEKGTSVYIKGIAEKPIKIPSQMYPILGHPLFLTHENTEDFPNTERTDQIRNIFNSIEPQVGRCYSNTEGLISALADKGFQAQSFVGWMFIGEQLPIHHCFAVLDDHVLDLAYRADLFYRDELVGKDKDETRKLFVDELMRIREQPNSSTGTFGKVSTGVLIIASPCKPAVGRKIYQDLIQAFPKHPCQKNVDSTGRNQTQRQFYERTNRKNEGRKP